MLCLSTSYKKVFNFIRLFGVFFTFIIIFSSFFSFIPRVSAIPTVGEFDANPGLVLSDKDIYSLPFTYSSAEKIQQYLQSQGSLLATLSVEISFEPGSGVINENAFLNKPEQFRPSRTVTPFLGRRMTAGELIWNLSRTNMSNSCGLTQNGVTYTANDICYNTSERPLNPAFLLAMIQKESGLVYGVNARLDPNSAQAQWLIDRAVGYYCFDGPPERSCYDQNPDWRYYKGIFRQLYYAVRLIRLREQTCNLGGQYAFRNENGVFQVGNVVRVGDFDASRNLIFREVLLFNGISCSLYIYTPYIISQRNVVRVMRELGADRNLVEETGLDPSYIPYKMIPFD